MELIFIYNAQKGRLNSLIDYIHKTVSPGTYSCNLCAITHNFKKKLKWDNLCKNLKSSSCKEKKYKEIKFLKEERNFDICSEFNTMLNYVKKLKFDETPNYNYLVGIFTNLLLII